jgi:hypothetical protein
MGFAEATAALSAEQRETIEKLSVNLARAAMTAHSDALRDKARHLTREIDARLGKTLTLAGGLTAFEKLRAALDEESQDHSHDAGHSDGHAPDHASANHDDLDTHDIDASGSTVVIERARHVVIHAPGPAPAPAPGHDKHKPVPTEAERRQAIRQAVSDLNDHWRLKEARIAEIEAAHRELSAPRR